MKNSHANHPFTNWFQTAVWMPTRSQRRSAEQIPWVFSNQTKGFLVVFFLKPIQWNGGFPIKISQLHQLDINPICKFVGHDHLHHGRFFFLDIPIGWSSPQPPEFPQTLPVRVKTIGRWPGRWSQPPHFGVEFRVATSAIVGGFNPAEKNVTIVVIQYMSCWVIVVVVVHPK